MVYLILTPAAVYIAILVWMYAAQESLVFHPRKGRDATPADAGLAFSEAPFTTADGVRLNAWFVPGPAFDRPDSKVVLFCHGNAGNLSNRLDTLRLFRSMGLSCLIFDYRGYGLSQGKPSEEGLALDAAAAWNYLVAAMGVNPSRIILWGRSLGGCVATRLASEASPSALIVESSFTSIPDVGAKLYPFLPVRLLSRFHFDAKSAIARVSCPILIIHSPDDEIASFALGQALYAAAPEPKRFLTLHGSHNDGFLLSGVVYTQGIKDFLSERGTF